MNDFSWDLRLFLGRCYCRTTTNDYEKNVGNFRWENGNRGKMENFLSRPSLIVKNVTCQPNPVHTALSPLQYSTYMLDSV